MALVALLSFASCSTTKDDSSAKSGGLKNEEDQDAEEEAEEDSTALPHPKHATAWDTRMLIASNVQPTAERVYSCIRQVTQIADEAPNQQDMMSTQTQMTQLVATDQVLYHYCFYQLMVRLDDRLAVGGPLMTEVATSFFDTMRAMWILARGLDAFNGRQIYFDYLQKRYVQISKDTFGRDVQVVGPPMGSVRSSFGTMAPVGSKPAGSAAP